MDFSMVIWDEDHDPDGNVQHISDADITKDEVMDVLTTGVDMDVSRSTGRPVVFGDTSTGRHLCVVFDWLEDDVVYPVTAFEVPRRRT